MSGPRSGRSLFWGEAMTLETSTQHSKPYLHPKPQPLTANPGSFNPHDYDSGMNHINSSKNKGKGDPSQTKHITIRKNTKPLVILRKILINHLKSKGSHNTAREVQDSKPCTSHLSQYLVIPKFLIGTFLKAITWP